MCRSSGSLPHYWGAECQFPCSTEGCNVTELQMQLCDIAACTPPLPPPPPPPSPPTHGALIGGVIGGIAAAAALTALLHSGSGGADGAHSSSVRRARTWHSPTSSPA